MYLSFFGLREQPFGVTPDPRFLYLSAAHREAFASLYYGIEANRGFLGLIAKPGMGKTTILFHLLEKFSSSARTAFVFQTQCNSREFLRFLLAELGYEGDTQDFVRLHDEFNRRLLVEARAGRRLIVVIDEAQNLDASVLETVRLLSDFETPRAKLMHIILAGQPELADKLASPGLAQLRQRISILHGLEPLPSWEIKNYIEHRMKVAGYQGEPVFAPEAYERIAEFTEGVPRNVNNLCFNALSLAYALQKKIVDMDVVKEVISDLDITRLTTETPAASVPLVPDYPSLPQARPVRKDSRSEILSPAEAAAYMQEVAVKLKNWQQSMESGAGGVRRSRTQTSSDIKQ
ncbi:MAG: AAA family ATPase [Terriglobales bacterium]